MSGPADPTDALPEAGGVYVFVMHCGRAFSARIGALGELGFEPGFYCYVGSARAGLRARVCRHLRRGGKRPHWHIDYLRPCVRGVGAMVWPGKDADECVLSGLVAEKAERSVPNFGCSDCACGSHLHFTRKHPAELLRQIAPEGARWIAFGGEDEAT
ncbi:MAG: GIY-YIG nuclease family protein [Candidatus Brocadiia bacterium]